MMKLKIIFILCSSVLFLCCSSTKRRELSSQAADSFSMGKDTALAIKVQMDNEDYFGELDGHLCMASYVKLAPEPLLAPLKSVKIQDGRIYVHDRSDRLVCYDMNGMVKYQIFAVGNGPGEYAEITSFTLDTTRGEIVLYDNTRTSLLYYSLKEGRFLRNTRFVKPTPSEMVFHDGMFFYNNRHHRNYPNDTLLHYSLLASADGLTIDKSFYSHNEAEENYIFSPSLQTFNVNDDVLYYCKNFDNKVYEIGKDTIKPRYEIELPNFLPVSVVEDKVDEWQLLRSGYSFGITHVYEIDGLLYFRFHNSGFYWNTLYDLREKKQICCVKALQEGGSSNIPLIDIINGVYDGMFFSVLTPEFIDYYISKDLTEYPEFLQRYDAETENPIIMFYRTTSLTQ